MTQEATLLADRFHDARQRFLATVESFTAKQMQVHTEAEHCTVAALAAHMANVHTVASGWVETALRGESLPQISMEDIDRTNHDQFERDANRDKQDILLALRTTGQRAEQTLRSLTDGDLSRPVDFSLLGGRSTVGTLVENALINHVESHLQSIVAAGSSSDGAAETTSS